MTAVNLVDATPRNLQFSDVDNLTAFLQHIFNSTEDTLTDEQLVETYLATRYYLYYSRLVCGICNECDNCTEHNMEARWINYNTCLNRLDNLPAYITVNIKCLDNADISQIVKEILSKRYAK